MSASKIQAAERPVGDVFSDEYRFSVPRYQRPYAWTTEHAGEMFDDLLAGVTAKPFDGETDPYFLGSIVLVKSEGDPDAEIVDGQQRLTTLTILMSSLRHHVSAPFASSLASRIFQKGDPIKKTVDQPRLAVRSRDQEFFAKYVQDPAGADKIESLGDILPESQKNMVENARLFAERLSSLNQTEVERLAEYVDRHTYLVVVSTQDFDSAYRVFAVLNERGLDLTHSDILKSEVIGAIPAQEQDIYTKMWETEEEDLGRNDFADLFAHIRTVFAKSKARESILKEFRTHVLSRFADSRGFIDDVLVPFSDAYEVVTRADYKSSSEPEEVNRVLRWLNLLDNFDWIPPAISYLSKEWANQEATRRFLLDLERLAASALIRRLDTTRRIERYGRLLYAIETDIDLYADDSPLQLSPEERAATRDYLRRDIYTVTRVRSYVLLRLDSALSSGGASYEHPIISVEHVLPQSPSEGSSWRAWFTDEEREAWVHKLANLVLLTRRKNSQASNYEFDVKKEKYFATAGGVSPFVLTTQVLQQATWTPAVLEARQEALVDTLAKLWRL
jgi:hypothetical protein